MHSRDKRNSQSFKDDGSTFCGTPFVVGQHVVCIGNVNDAALSDVILIDPVQIPEINRVYTVASVSISELGRQVCLTLVEIPQQRVAFIFQGQYMRGNVLFPAKFFRPLQRLKLEDFMPIVEHLTNEVTA